MWAFFYWIPAPISLLQSLRVGCRVVAKMSLWICAAFLPRMCHPTWHLLSLPSNYRKVFQCS